MVLLVAVGSSMDTLADRLCRVQIIVRSYSVSMSDQFSKFGALIDQH